LIRFLVRVVLDGQFDILTTSIVDLVIGEDELLIAEINSGDIDIPLDIIFGHPVYVVPSLVFLLLATVEAGLRILLAHKVSYLLSPTNYNYGAA
jgi:hypothetical protein